MALLSLCCACVKEEWPAKEKKMCEDSETVKSAQKDSTQASENPPIVIEIDDSVEVIRDIIYF